MSALEIEELLANSRIGRLGMADASGRPYVIPLPFCWHEGALYLRLPSTGRKGEVLRQNSLVCFEVDTFADDFSAYASVLIEGRLSPVAELELKQQVRAASEAKYRRLRGGHRPGHGRRSSVAQLPLQRIDVARLAGRKKAPRPALVQSSHTGH